MMPACAHGIATIIILSLSCTYTGAFRLINRRELRGLNSRLDAEPAVIAGVAAATATVGAIAWCINGADDRAKRTNYAEREARDKAHREELERLAYIEPREVWREEELRSYDGSGDESGPILMAVKGDVFNVWKGRNFYGAGGEYHIMAGRDATRFLAKNRLEEESDEEKSVDLNIAERANLEAWYWTIKNKYQLVGSLEGYDESKTKEN
ncbi:hypothetical protein ACHAXA_010348 [Cyclostephanos tholiformis]|uniref:Cytochrome b5 heme-binding domain-containing protein n=1 Tax=Cyclostephanos tholiformis TaxID=382380 RepID=A0ABD3RT25_9STRA